MQEAFEAFCNKNVAGSSSAELMASFCDNLLKKVGGTEVKGSALDLQHIMKRFIKTSVLLRLCHANSRCC